MKIVADHKIPFLKGVLEPFSEVVYLPGEEIAPRHLKNSDALIIRSRTKCTKELLKGSNLKMIATATIGYDHIDTVYCEKNGIKWANAPGCNSGSVNQYIASALVKLSNKFNFSFAEKTLGIIGVGNIGKKVSKMASLLGMNVLLNDPPRERLEGKGLFVNLKEIIQHADIITFHVPLIMKGVDKTYHLFNEDFIRYINPGAIIINASRGEVVDSRILIESLQNQKIKSAVLDVWENEPNISTELLHNVAIATPHIAGYSMDGKALGTAMVVRELSNFFGLGLNHWFPLALPAFEKKIISFDNKNYSTEELAGKAILATYDVLRDDKNLREKPEKFEFLRGIYPKRREFSAFNVDVKYLVANSIQLLKSLGFNVPK